MAAMTKVKDARRCTCHHRPKVEVEAYTRALETIVAVQADQLEMMRTRQKGYVVEIARLKSVVECLTAEVQRGIGT